MTKPTFYIFCLLLTWATFGCDIGKTEPDGSTVLPPEDPTNVAHDRELLDRVQRETFNYFWEYAHPTSGMARERTNSNETVTSGGTGFGVQAIIVGVHRKFITRQEATERLLKLCTFLASADRFHGVWPHWLNGSNGKVIPFSAKDNGGDVIETAFLINGLLTARAYFNGADAQETELRTKITQLWETVEWDWYASRGDNKLYWHWSPDFGWEMNMPIQGWNEGLIAYVLALASPTHAISPAVYQTSWIGSGFRSTQTLEGYKLEIGPPYGGPLFFAHYSFLSLDPRQMQDQYVNYWQHNVKHTLINRSYSIHLAPREHGYSESLWGLTASDDPFGYSAHSPTNDNGTVTPTAALGSFPYTPYYSMQVLRNLYGGLSSIMIGPYGPYDAYNRQRNWVGRDYLAIDQGPIVAMMENYRSGLLWGLFTNLPEIQAGLTKAGITKPVYDTGFYLAIPEVRSGQFDLLKHPDADAYGIDVAVKEAGPMTLTVEKPDGTVMETLWNNETKASGQYQVNFGKTLSPGAYKLRLKASILNKELSVFLH
ncbi:glucoamylase family protein [Rufibacter hautae]|uniref:Beta-glucosidase n=1 Tax=Rufibacter hautae TaxID=2595005 RepID=A0A5B6TTF1_9BACT|nr:glucoamylase family protein [Rufibacter hautae]KAA3439798.1 beta-glucosidase [Rufibacter hautae]